MSWTPTDTLVIGWCVLLFGTGVGVAILWRPTKRRYFIYLGLVLCVIGVAVATIILINASIPVIT